MNNIIFYPSRLGQRLRGVEKTPNILYNWVQGNKKMIDCTRDINNNLLKLYNENLRIKSSKINIGGDHSMSIATVASSLMMYDNLKVIWIDAHADINTRRSSSTKNMHGMPLSFLTKLDNKRFEFCWPKLRFENIMYIGVRDLDCYEKKIVKEKNIKILKSSDINLYPNRSLKKIKKFINGDPTHISFDVDSIDPKYMPCTGTKVNGGIELNKAKYILDKLFIEDIINMDIVELNLKLGEKKDEEKSIENFVKLFDNYLNWKI